MHRWLGIGGALVLLAAGALGMPASQAAEPEGPAPVPVRTWLDAAAFAGDDGVVVNVTVEDTRPGQANAKVCVDAFSVEDHGDGTRTVRTLWTCSRWADNGQTAVDYHFDPVQWLASVDAVGLPASYTEQVERETFRGWEAVSSTSAPTEVTVSMRWRGTGEVQPHTEGGYHPCYVLPPLCIEDVDAWVQRDAEVAGTVSLGGFDVHVAVPAGHAGTITMRP